MGVVIPPGFAQVIQQFGITGDNEPMITTYAVSLGGGGSVSIANSLRTAWSTAFLAETRNTTQIQKCVLRVGQDGGDPVVYESDTAWAYGTASGAGLPTNCALLVKKNTGLGGRKHRGRMYVPGVLAEGSVDHNGVIDSTARNNLQTAYNGWLTAVQGLLAVGDMYLLHGTGSVVAPTQITSLTVEERIATQRGRMRR